MGISGERKNNAFVIHVRGRMDLETSEQFNKAVGRYLAENDTAFILNCGELEYLNSTGLRSFIHLAQQLEERNRKLVICGLHGIAKEIIDIAEMGSYFNIVDNEEEALKAV